MHELGHKRQLCKITHCNWNLYKTLTDKSVFIYPVKLKLYIKFVRKFFRKKKSSAKKRSRIILHKIDYPSTNVVKNVKSERNTILISMINFGIRVCNNTKWHQAEDTSITTKNEFETRSAYLGYHLEFRTCFFNSKWLNLTLYKENRYKKKQATFDNRSEQTRNLELTVTCVLVPASACCDMASTDNGQRGIPSSAWRPAELTNNMVLRVVFSHV